MSANTVPKGATSWLISGLVILVLAFLLQGQNVGVYNIGFSLENKPSNTVGVYYKVTKVTDGDTFHVDLNGTDEKIRLIGINTPETVDPRTPVQCFGKEAGARMKSLAQGKLVRLEFDSTQDVRDIYNRLLVYAYLEDGQMLNRKMIAEGYAYEYTYMTPYKYQTEFRELQNLAKASMRGLWAKETCSGSKTMQ